MEQNENTLSVLKIAPGQHPQQVEIDNDLKALQQAVGGSIGASYPFEDPVAIVYNDDGKLMGLPLNRALRDENGEMYDAIRYVRWCCRWHCALAWQLLLLPMTASLWRKWNSLS